MNAHQRRKALRVLTRALPVGLYVYRRWHPAQVLQVEAVNPGPWVRLRVVNHPEGGSPWQRWARPWQLRTCPLQPQHKEAP